MQRRDFLKSLGIATVFGPSSEGAAEGATTCDTGRILRITDLRDGRIMVVVRPGQAYMLEGYYAVSYWKDSPRQRVSRFAWRTVCEITTAGARIVIKKKANVYRLRQFVETDYITIDEVDLRSEA